MTLRRAAAVLVGAVVAVASTLPAAAATRRLSLHAARQRLLVGEAVKLSGRVSAGRRGEVVRIVDGRGRVVARPRTRARGRYRLWLRPRRDVRLTARWHGARSRAVRLRVKPRVWVRLRRVRLFGKARVDGAVVPAGSGKITVQVRRNGRALLTRRVSLRRGGRFVARFRVRRPGRYKARVFLRRRGRPVGRDVTGSHRPRVPLLRPGTHSHYVRLLEERLRALRYLLPRADWHFGFRTVDALRAFNKVQRRARSGVVTEATWRALAQPRRPRARASRPRRHIEIDQTKQVLYVVRRGRIARILHTSTGANGVTRDGVFRVHRKLAGYSPGRLYYPSYFDGLRAIHGWPQVPVSPASHGCARVPMWAARWIFARTPIGIQVRIYH
jgi:hypothetical protein